MLNRDLRLGLRDWQWVGDGELAPRPARLDLTGWPPAVLSDIYVEPANDNLTLTGHAPGVGVSNFVAPGEDALTLTGEAPGVLVDEVVFPGADTLTLTGYAPAVTAGVGTTVEPGTDTLTITGEAPTPIVDQVPAPGADTLVVTGYAPLAPASEVVTPGADTLSITEYAPTIDSGAGNTTVEPGTDVLTITGLAPAVGNDIPVGNDTLIITEHAPNVSTDSLVAPGVDSLVITGLAPLVSSDQIVAPGQDSLEITEYAPTPVVDQVLAPGVDSLIVTEYAPAPVIDQIVAPAQETLSIVEYAPTVSTESAATTFSIVEGDAINAGLNWTISGTPVEGDLIVHFVMNRSGKSEAAHTAPVDTNTNTWTKIWGVDSMIDDGDYRCSVTAWVHKLTSTDVGGTYQVQNPDDRCFNVIIHPDSAYNFSHVETAAAGSGSADLDGISSGNTSSISGSNLFIMAAAISRRNGSATWDYVDEYFDNATGDELTDSVSSHGLLGFVAIHNTGQSGGVKSDTFNSGGSGNEGVVACMVFEDGS